jgi:hypothetical protein
MLLFRNSIAEHSERVSQREVMSDPQETPSSKTGDLARCEGEKWHQKEPVQIRSWEY